MATRTIATFYSDLSGAEIPAGAAGTVQFALDGRSYEIDLTDSEQQQLRDVLSEYVAAGRPAGGTRRRRRPGQVRQAPAPPAPSAPPEATPQEIRAWALEHGHAVTARGRIPAQVREAYVAAHS